MGNGVPFHMMCCDENKNFQTKDIDIKKNSNEKIYYINYKSSHLINKDLNKDDLERINNKKDNLKKVQTKHSSENDSRKKEQNNKKDSDSNIEQNISLYNNTFQILNNTQQCISTSNKENSFKNNLINNQKNKSFINSKIDSKNCAILNLNKINNNCDDKSPINIKTKLLLSGELFFNEIIEIDKFGMKNGLRKKNDGITIFGIKNENDNNSLNTPIYDYLLDIKFLEDNNYHNKKKNNGKVFQIFLDKREKAYALFYFHNSLILYYKINDYLFFDLDKDYYLILGDIFITIEVKKSTKLNEKIIDIQVEIENEKPKKYTFEQKDTPITIGRVNSIINIQKPSISKTHGRIDFTNDMFYYIDMKSTNGSTLLIKEDDIIKIKGEMNFKLEDISFNIKEIGNE